MAAVVVVSGGVSLLSFELEHPSGGFTFFIV